MKNVRFACYAGLVMRVALAALCSCLFVASARAASPTAATQKSTPEASAVQMKGTGTWNQQMRVQPQPKDPKTLRYFVRLHINLPLVEAVRSDLQTALENQTFTKVAEWIEKLSSEGGDKKALAAIATDYLNNQGASEWTVRVYKDRNTTGDPTKNVANFLEIEVEREIGTPSSAKIDAINKYLDDKNNSAGEQSLKDAFAGVPGAAEVLSLK